MGITTDPVQGIIVAGPEHHDVTFVVGGDNTNQRYSVRNMQDKVTSLLAADGPVKNNTKALDALYQGPLMQAQKDISNILQELAAQDRLVDDAEVVLGTAMATAEQLGLNLENAMIQLAQLQSSVNINNFTRYDLADAQDDAASLRQTTSTLLATLSTERADFDAEVSDAYNVTEQLKALTADIRNTSVGLNSTITDTLRTAISNEVSRALKVETDLSQETAELSAAAFLELSNQNTRLEQNLNTSFLETYLNCVNGGFGSWVVALWREDGVWAQHRLFRSSSSFSLSLCLCRSVSASPHSLPLSSLLIFVLASRRIQHLECADQQLRGQVQEHQRLLCHHSEQKAGAERQHLDHC